MDSVVIVAELIMLDCYNFDFMTILINIRMIIKSARNLRTHMLLVLTY